MSILLDALRRSEAQRRLGETPTLQTPVTSANGPSDDRRYWIPVSLVVLTSALITWIGMAQFSTEPPGHPPSGIPSTGESEQNQAQVAADSAAASRPARPGRTVSTPVQDFAAPERAGVSGASPGQPEATSPVSPTNFLEQPQLVIAPPQEPGQLNPDAAAERLEASPGEVAKEAEKGGDRLEPYVSEPLSYWQMPQSLRDSMPPLHITVLVYAEKPSDRFLLINGERLHEKETLSDGLVLEEIQRDRAIFTYRNYRFQVKS